MFWLQFCHFLQQSSLGLDFMPGGCKWLVFWSLYRRDMIQVLARRLLVPWDKSELQKTEGTRDQIVAKASYKVPALLHVNRESRGFAQAYYTRALEEQLGGNAVYINFKTDTLHLEGDP
jgi:hypothetical protein